MFVPKGRTSNKDPINNTSAPIQVMAWHRIGYRIYCYMYDLISDE